MIRHENGVFHLASGCCSYIFRITGFGHLEHIHFGVKMPADCEIESLRLKTTAMIGSSVLYDDKDGFYCLDTLPLEWSGIGKGDYRNSPAEIRMADRSYVADFKYKGYKIGYGHHLMSELPAASGENPDDPDGCAHLVVEMGDETGGAGLELIYTVFPECDVITRRVVLKNISPEGQLQIRQLMSMMLDLPDRDFVLTTLHTLVLSACVVCMAVGVPIGIAAAHRPRGSELFFINESLTVVDVADQRHG